MDRARPPSARTTSARERRRSVPPRRRRLVGAAGRALRGAFGGALGLAVALGGCAYGVGGRVRPDLPAGHASAPQRDVAGLGNLGQVDAGLWRSAQPSADGYRRARELGVRTVVDLRGGKENAARVRAAGLAYVPLRTSARRLDEDDLVAFLRVATDPARRPVLVHCAAGHDRTGACVAAYRRVVDGWTADQALGEMNAFGAAPWYGNLVALVRGLSPDELRRRVAAPAGPSEAVAPAPAPAPAR